MEKTFKDLANTMRVLAEGFDMAAGQFNYLQHRVFQLEDKQRDIEDRVSVNETKEKEFKQDVINTFSKYI